MFKDILYATDKWMSKIWKYNLKMVTEIATREYARRVPMDIMSASSWTLNIIAMNPNENFTILIAWIKTYYFNVCKNTVNDN